MKDIRQAINDLGDNQDGLRQKPKQREVNTKQVEETLSTSTEVIDGKSKHGIRET